MSRVARYQADRTNQKLYFARLACKQCADTDNWQLEQAARENAVFQLQGAVLAYLQELARYYKLNVAHPTLDNLRESLAQRGQVSPEIIILQQLSDNGYLADLNHAYNACQYAPDPVAPSYDDDASLGSNLIRVKQEPLAWLPDVATLRTWQQQLVTLIDRFRDEMIEF